MLISKITCLKGIRAAKLPIILGIHSPAGDFFTMRFFRKFYNLTGKNIEHLEIILIYFN